MAFPPVPALWQAYFSLSEYLFVNSVRRTGATVKPSVLIIYGAPHPLHLTGRRDMPLIE